MKVYVLFFTVMVAALFACCEGQSCLEALKTAEQTFEGTSRSTRLDPYDLLLIYHGDPFSDYKCQIVRTLLIADEVDPVSCLPLGDYFCDVPSQTRSIVDPCTGLEIECDNQATYRTATGECNNLENPTWGRANTAYRRFLPQSTDGSNCTAGVLPFSREVSNELFATTEEQIIFENRLSYMMMQWGQFISHDLSSTPLANGPINCCGTPTPIPGCDTIVAPDDDPIFTDGCINYLQSLSANDCEGAAQQINAKSSYLDASVVYGDSLRKQRQLRTYHGGLLKTAGWKLSDDVSEGYCFLVIDEYDELRNYCPTAGDERVALTPGLTALHTTFQQEHNRIVTKLAKLNPHWTDQKLFDEGRRIVSAQIQLITYREYLPLVLGNETVKHLDIDVGHNVFKDTYDSSIMASIFNAFEVAAFRFTLSMTNDVVGKRSTKSHHVLDEQSLSDNWYNPEFYHENGNLSSDYLNYWTLTSPLPRADRFIQPSIRNNFLGISSFDPYDLAATTIKRGRDHAIPSYNDFREFCGLPRATTFETLPGGLIDHDLDAAAILQSLYTCPDDIELFAGGLSERRYPDSLVGPVFSCLIGIQFKALRDGDRFFFERQDELVGFSKDQLAELKKTTLASIMCSSSPSFNYIQPNAFLLPTDSQQNSQKKYHKNSKYTSQRSLDGNPLVSCDSIPRMNLLAWRERRGYNTDTRSNGDNQEESDDDAHLVDYSKLYNHFYNTLDGGNHKYKKKYTSKKASGTRTNYKKYYYGDQEALSGPRQIDYNDLYNQFLNDK